MFYICISKGDNFGKTRSKITKLYLVVNCKTMIYSCLIIIAF